MPTFALLLVFSLLPSLAAASLPVLAAKDQAALLKSADPKLAANKRLAYDFYRVVLCGARLDQTEKYMREDYMQHNPNVGTGRKGFIEFFKGFGGPREIPTELRNLAHVVAEGDYVLLTFVAEHGEGKEKWTTTWFDLFRVQDGKIAEHWDNDLKDEEDEPEAPPAKPAPKPAKKK